MAVLRNLTNPAPPSLPLAPEQYERRYQDQYSNVFRLYFNQLSNVLQALFGTNGGQYIECPNGLFFNTVDQTFPLEDTAYPVVFNATYLNNAVALVPGSASRIAVSVPGVYNFQFTAQLLSSNSSDKTVYVWISRNGVDIGFSTRAVTLSANGEYAELTWAFSIDLDTDEFIELKVSATNTNIELHADPAAAPHPGIPSSVMTVSYVSPLPVPRPTPP
jgi:hypothetical protein